MPTNFPTSVDALTNPVSNDSLNSPSHSLQHANANDAIEAIEGFLLNSYQPTFRNILINGSFGIDQRNAGSAQTFTAAAALAYSVDRWYGYCTGANVTGQRIAGTAPDQFLYRFTGATSNTAIGFGQRIEAENSFHFAGQTATLSVSLASSSLTTVTWTAFYANTTDTFGTLASPTRTQIATGTFAINSTLTRYSVNIAVPAAATTGIEIVFTTGALIAAQTLSIDNAQFELGTSATAFERRFIGIELELCQRYYINRKSDIAVINGFTTTNTQKWLSISLPTRMRAAPNFTPFDGLGNANRCGTLDTSGTGTDNVVPGFQTSYSTLVSVLVSGTNSGLYFGYVTEIEL